MIRAAIIALALSVTPAMAQTKSDVEQTQGFILASFSRIYCGLAIPQKIEDELRHLADKYNWNRYEFALMVIKAATEKGRHMTVEQRDLVCTVTLRAYRNLGLQR